MSYRNKKKAGFNIKSHALSPNVERKVRKNEKVVNLVRQWGSPGDLKLVGRVLSNGSSRAKKKESTRAFCVCACLCVRN